MNAKKAVTAFFVLLPIMAGNAFAEDTPYLKIERLSGQTAEIACKTGDTAGSDLIGVLYNEDTPVEIQKIENTPNGKASIQFNRDINDYDLKLFLWNNNMTALTPPCIRKALNLQFAGNYNKITDGTSAIYSVTDSGSNPMTLFFNNSSDDITVSFDIKAEAVPTTGSIIGMMPCSGDMLGCGAGLGYDGEKYIPCATLPDIVFPFEAEHKDVFAGWINISLHFLDGKCEAVYSNPSDGTVYIDCTIPGIRDVGTSAHPVDKLVFGMAYAGNTALPAQDASFLIKNINIERT